MHNLVFGNQPRRKAVWGPKRTLLAALISLLGMSPPASAAGGPPRQGHNANRNNNYSNKLDDELSKRSLKNGSDVTPVIVELVPGVQVPAEFKKYVNPKAGRMDIISGQALNLPGHVLKQIAAHPSVFRVHYDRPLATQNYRTAVTVGARAVFSKYGYTGAGVGVAVIDSGVASWHDDLINVTSKTFPYGNQRVAKFVDFVNGRTLPYDDNVHGTHVTGTIAGLGYDSNGEKAGIAPLSSIVALKVLDQNGAGRISNMIAALNWIALNHKTYNIRVVNMSVGANIHESYWTDPLTLAAKAVVDKGVTIVAAAGNHGKNALGQLQWGGITAPGNAPWVLTVGASSTMGTLDPSDDQMAAYSSSGPTPIDYAAKPDLVAPGTGTVSLAAPGSTFYVNKPANLVRGTNGQFAYLTLSGTSMSAPVVSGTVALMLQANPNLTPNLIKAILEYTADPHAGYSPLRQGAGFLDTQSAVDLARFYAKSGPGSKFPVKATWSRTINWGNKRITGADINPTANAWGLNVVWGMARTLDTGDNIIWGTAAKLADSTVWGGALSLGNIVWGMDVTLLDNIVWGMDAMLFDNIVWGMDCGSADCDNIVWGMFDPVANIVWGMSAPGDNIVWGMDGLPIDNIVWGMSDVTWGSSGEDEAVYPDNVASPLPSTVIDLNILSTLPAGSDVNGTMSLVGGF